MPQPLWCRLTYKWGDFKWTCPFGYLCLLDAVTASCFLTQEVTGLNTVILFIIVIFYDWIEENKWKYPGKTQIGFSHASLVLVEYSRMINKIRFFNVSSADFTSRDLFMLLKHFHLQKAVIPDYCEMDSKGVHERKHCSKSRLRTHVSDIFWTMWIGVICDSFLRLCIDTSSEWWVHLIKSK